MNSAALFMVFLLCAAVVNAADFSVGVSPNILNIGDVSPGEQKLTKFSIFTVSSDPLLVYLTAESGNMDFFNRGYTDLMPQFSEEPTASWVEFVSNPVEIDTTGNKTAGRSWKDISFILNIPEDAEPGYHIINIMPNPTIYGGGPNAPVGTTIVSVVKITAIFNIKGEAKRDGVILDTTAHSYTDTGFKLRTFFKNTGTLTLFTRADNEMYSENGTFIGKFSSQNEYVKPQTTKTMETPVNIHLDSGRYRVVSTTNFVTGEVQKDSAINLYAAETTVEQQEFPWLTMILLALVVIIIAVWWFRAKKV